MDFENAKMINIATSNRVEASKESKHLILIYKETKDANLMDIMKRLTVKKKRIDKRLNGRPS